MGGATLPPATTPSPTPPSPPTPSPPSPSPSPPSSMSLYKNKFYQYDKKALISKPKKEKSAQACLNKCKKTKKPKKCVAMNWNKKKGCYLLSSYKKLQNKKG